MPDVNRQFEVGLVLVRMQRLKKIEVSSRRYRQTVGLSFRGGTGVRWPRAPTSWGTKIVLETSYFVRQPSDHQMGRTKNDCPRASTALSARNCRQTTPKCHPTNGYSRVIGATWRVGRSKQSVANERVATSIARWLHIFVSRESAMTPSPPISQI